VRLGLRAVCGDVPLYREFLRTDDDGPVVRMARDYHFWVAQYSEGPPADAATEWDLMRKYDLGYSDLLELQLFLQGLPFESCSFSTPLVDRVLQVDLSDLLERPLAVVAA
jgi:hypothetical protein